MDQTEDKIRKKNISNVIKSFLFYGVLGATCIFSGDMDGRNQAVLMYLFGVAVLVGAAGCLIYYFVRCWLDKNFWVEQGAAVVPSKVFRAVTAKDLFQQDVRVLTIIKKDLSLLMPFVLSILAIILFLFFEFKGFFLLGMIKPLHLGPWVFLVYPYALSFICVSFFILGYLSLGEVLQRRLSSAPKPFIVDLVIDYVYALPFIAILSLLWCVFLFLNKKKDHDLTSSLITTFQDMSLYLMMIAVKYYTYVNLAIIAYEDEYKIMPLKESFEFMKKHKEGFLVTLKRSGLFLAFCLIGALVFFIWNERFHWVHSKMIGITIGVLMVAQFLFALLSEQLMILAYFIKTRHPESRVNDILG